MRMLPWTAIHIPTGGLVRTPPLRRKPRRGRWFGRVRRGCGAAAATIFASPGLSGPDGTAESRSDFARRKFCSTSQVRVPRNGGSRGRAAWRQERLCRSCRLRPPHSVFWFLFHVEKEPAPQGGTLSRRRGGETPPVKNQSSPGSSRVNFPNFPPRNSSSRTLAIRSVSNSPPEMRMPRFPAASSRIRYP